MRGNEFLLFLLCAAVIGVPILACIIKYFADYAADLRYVKRRIAEADGWDEYVHWRHMLRCLHWSILPGLTPRRVRRIAKRFELLFHKPKHKGKKEANDGLFSMLAPSLAAICLCCVCLVSASYAWFTASVESKSSTLTAASYKINVSINNSSGANVTAKSGVYTLNKGNSYTVTLTATGTASTGYCVIKSDGETWYTDQISTTEPFTFTITPGEDAEFTFEAVWGSYSGEPSVETGADLNYPAATEEDNTSSSVQAAPAAAETKMAEQASEETATDSAAEPTTETEQNEQEGGETPADTNAATTYEDTSASNATSDGQQQNGTQDDSPEDIASDTSAIK